MSKQYNIRWKQSDQEDLRKAVRNFNAKIDRIIKKNPKMKNSLPEKISVREMRKLITTRQDLKREINALKRFSKKGAETMVNVPDNDYNLQITKWQRTEMNRRIGIINRKRKKRLEFIESIELESMGESLGYTIGEFGMGKADKVALTPMNAFTPRMDRTSLNKKFKNILKESQTSYWREADVRLRENFISAIEQNLSESDRKDIVDSIRSMNIDLFLKIFRQNNGSANFEFVYIGKNMSNYDLYLSALKSIWMPER